MTAYMVNSKTRRTLKNGLKNVDTNNYNFITTLLLTEIYVVLEQRVAEDAAISGAKKIVCTCVAYTIKRYSQNTRIFLRKKYSLRGKKLKILSNAQNI
jgi:hypothetical protein